MINQKFLFLIAGAIASLMTSHPLGAQVPGKVTLPVPIGGPNPNTGVVLPPPSGGVITRPPVIDDNSTASKLKNLTELRDISETLVKHIWKLESQLDLINQSTFYTAWDQSKNEFVFSPVQVAFTDPADANKVYNSADAVFQTIYALIGASEAIYKFSQATVAGAAYTFNSDKKLPPDWRDLRKISPFDVIAGEVDKVKGLQTRSWEMIEAYSKGLNRAFAEAGKMHVVLTVAKGHLAQLKPNATTRGHLEVIQSIVDALVAKFGKDGNPAALVQYQVLPN